MPKPGIGNFAGRFSEVLAERLRRIGRAERESDAASQAADPAPIRLRAMSDAPLGCVALGASTGGPHALFEFLRALPGRIGAPILVTQHLPPIFMPHFARQLESASGRAARVVEAGDVLVPDFIHVAPGDAHLCVERCGAEVRVRLERKRAPSGCCPSADPMLISVAETYGEAGVGVMLSGMGRDGLIGSRRLVEAGGAMLAQDRHSAAIWGMPRAVAEARPRIGGAAAGGARPPNRRTGGGRRMEISDSARRILASVLEARTGQQLTMNRRWRIDTALASIMRERGFDTVDQLVSRLVSGKDPSLSEQVIDALLNNETYFFRDRLPFDLLMGGPVLRLEQARAREKRLSIWCAGCSTGQEAYSLAMSFADDKARWQGWTIDIVGTDLSRSAIERARSGTYSQFEVQRGLPVMQMIRWFEELGGGDWRASDKLRGAVRFEVRNMIEPPPHPGKFDIILCRNVLLYFAPDMRRLAFNRLAEAMAPDGTLMLGAGETVIGQTERFVSDPEFRGLYRSSETQADVGLARARVA